MTSDVGLHGLLRSWSYKTFFMLNSVKHEIFSANKYENANIFMFISREMFMISYV